MNILDLLKKESADSRVYLLVLLLIATGSEIFMLHIIETNLHVTSTRLDFRSMMLFITLLISDMLSIGRARKHSMKIIENMAMNLFEQSVAQLRQVKFASFENIGKSSIYNTIVVDTQKISQLSSSIPGMMSATFVTSGGLLYLLWLSPLAFLLTFTALIAGGAAYILFFTKIKAGVMSSREREKEMFHYMDHLIFGFKELKINERKMDDFFQTALEKTIALYKTIRVAYKNYIATVEVLSLLLDYARFVPILFVLPLVAKVTDSLIPQAVTIMLFIPLTNLKQILPDLLTANISVKRLMKLNQTLQKLGKDDSELPEKSGRQFQTIAYENIRFAYTDEHGEPLFAIGPMNLTLTAGETLFLIGGNGSGKTTLMKVMVGLYPPSAGTIKIDGTAVQMEQHRHLFSTIFTDFHLFDRLYGLPDVEAERVQQLLELMKLTHKIEFQGGKFSTLDLSTGQRKRLALIGSILEDKPVYIFDEWAAGQDPEFREYFYHTLLPAFKQQGKTVLAITHDDQYFHLADRILKMGEDGLTEISKDAAHTLVA